MNIPFKDTSRKAELGDVVELQGQNQEVVKCQETDVLMLNIDANELKSGDLHFIKALGLTISNPDTDKPVALGVDYEEDTWGHRIKKYFESDDSDDEDDDDGFFSSGGFLGGSSSWSPSHSGGYSGGVSSGGGFGGFGGGHFSGGGAGRSF